MASIQEIETLVETFADQVMAQDNAPSADVGNKHAEQYCEAALKLLRLGPAAIDAFTELLNHHDASMQVRAASCLPRDRTDEADATLKPIANGRATSSARR